MGDGVERDLPDLFAFAQSQVSSHLFERADEGTRWAQPALYCAALAGWERLRGAVEPDAFAGHSLGEIAALAAAGALSAEDGLRLVAARGRLMHEAALETGASGMLAVRVRDRAAVDEVARSCGLAIANDNAPDQLVVSGALSGLDAAARLLGERGMRTKRLPVAAAFHSPFMEPAVARLRAIVHSIYVHEPSVPVWSCVSGEPFEDIRGQLVRAITSPVRWTDVLRSLQASGVTRFVETGPGRVLTGLVGKTLDGVEAEAASTVAAVHA